MQGSPEELIMIGYGRSLVVTMNEKVDANARNSAQYE